MWIDLSLGVSSQQVGQEGMHASSLSLGACICRATICIQSTLITDTYGISIMPATMRTYLLLWATSFYTTITADDVVVANAIPTSSTMPTVNVCCRRALTRPHGRAVQYDFTYLSHFVYVISFIDNLGVIIKID